MRLLGYRALLAAILITAALHAQTPIPKNPLGTSPEVVAAGRALYNSTCTDCHGVDGGPGARAPELGGNRRYFRLSEASIFDTIKNGIHGTAMPSFSNLSDDDIWRIVVYIRNLRGTAVDSNVPGNLENGVAIFSGKGGCQSCHMIRGKGGTIGPDLSSIGGLVTLKRIQEVLTQDTAIPIGYRPVKVTTQTGEVVEGVARNEDGFSIQILDQQNTLHLYDKSELKEITYGKKSLMPHNYDKVLTAGEFQDLLAMLSRQARTKVEIKQQGEGENGR
ncbi:MAG TPA: c-type cytochrome [Terriglobales bacterium]|jgi:putative heme-binding domain-containing protein